MSRPVIRLGVSFLTRAQSRFRAGVLVWGQPSGLVKLFIGLVVSLVVAYLYVFFASAGRLYSWNSQTNYFDMLAEGFRAGHLHLSVEPSPELLAMPDPTDIRHEDLWLWDASLFRGHYYLYWGPVPAILLAIIYSWHESSTGILVSAPWTWLALLASVYLAILLFRPMVRRWMGLPVGNPVNWMALFCVAAALILATTPAAATLGMWLATMRYQADYSSGLMFLGTIGCWLWVHRLPWRGLRSVGAAACAFIGAASIIVGLLMGFRGYYNQFERNNPRLYQEFARFNFCPVEPPSGKNPMAMSDGRDLSGPSASGPQSQ